MAALELWIDVGAISDVPAQGARRVETPTGPVAVFRTRDGRFFALVDKCPHKGGPLSEGIVHDDGVSCPLHNWVIDLGSGEPRGADAGKGCAPPVPVKVEDGRILLALRR
ncbi:MAG: nitrite reductase small subunit NirD [Maricaulaceae bacterium]|jgi:nitrite reductase (NADH) small subunit